MAEKRVAILSAGACIRGVSGVLEWKAEAARWRWIARTEARHPCSGESWRALGRNHGGPSPAQAKMKEGLEGEERRNFMLDSTGRRGWRVEEELGGGYWSGERGGREGGWVEDGRAGDTVR